MAITHYTMIFGCFLAAASREANHGQYEGTTIWPNQKQKLAEASNRNFSTPREERKPTERITIDDLEAAADEYNWKMTSVQDL